MIELYSSNPMTYEKQEVNTDKVESAMGILPIINIFYLTCLNFRNTYESSSNSSKFYGPDGGPYTHMVTDKISKSTKPAFR